MKLVMTLLCHDEADIVDAQIAFHLNAGVDFVSATDNASVDGTSEILRSYEGDGFLHLIREPGPDMRQEEWVTRMGRPESFYDRVVVDDEALARGMADGSLVLDTRLRDALRALDTGADGFARPPGPAARLRFEWPSLADDAAHAAEVEYFVQADLARLQRRLDEVGRRLGDPESRAQDSAALPVTGTR